MPAHLRASGHGHEEPHFCIVLEGAFEERGSACHVSAGTMRASPAGDVHDLHFSNYGAHCLLLLLGAELTREARLPGVRRFVRGANIINYARRIAAEVAGSPLIVELNALELIAALSSGHPDRGAGQAPPWLARVRDSLHGSECGFPTTAQLAAEAGLHPVYVARAFRRWYGCSLAGYARRLRLERARRMLLDTRDPLARVAAHCGFADQSHLTRALKNALGTTPAALRRMVAGVQDKHARPS